MGGTTPLSRPDSAEIRGRATRGSATQDARRRKDVVAAEEQELAGSFRQVLRRTLSESFIRRGKTISEEELFAGVVSSIVETRDGGFLSAQFSSLLWTFGDQARAGKENAGFEDAARKSLRFLAQTGALSRSDIRFYQRSATAVSQLDGRRELWDEYAPTAAVTAEPVRQVATRVTGALSERGVFRRIAAQRVPEG